MELDFLGAWRIFKINSRQYSRIERSFIYNKVTLPERMIAPTNLPINFLENLREQHMTGAVDPSSNDPMFRGLSGPSVVSHSVWNLSGDWRGSPFAGYRWPWQFR